MALKKRSYENLSAANVLKVIKLLEADKPVTKKDACGILNISYNTTRLAKIIADYHEKVEYVASRKAYNRGRPASKQEIAEAATGYLEGDSISQIASNLFRSTAFIKTLIDKVGVPQRGQEESEGTDIIPEQCRAEDFQVGEIVWSAKYHAIAEVKRELNVEEVGKLKGMVNKDYEEEYSSKCYQVYVMEKVETESPYFPHITKGGFNSYAPAYDLGKLEHLKEYGVELGKL
jgi:hypothetical protein